jgi:hypothetical protein
MHVKIICVIDLGYVAATVLTFILFRFQTAAFWGSTAYVNLCFQILLGCVFFLFRGVLSKGWKITCCCSILLNLLLVVLGFLFMNTFVSSP